MGGGVGKRSYLIF